MVRRGTDGSDSWLSKAKNSGKSSLGKALHQMILSLRLTAANIDMTPPSGEDD